METTRWTSQSNVSVSRTAVGLPKCRSFPGVLSYGTSPDEAMAKAEVLALALCPNSLLAQREQQGRQDGVPNVRNCGMRKFLMLLLCCQLIACGGGGQGDQ